MNEGKNKPDGGEPPRAAAVSSGSLDELEVPGELPVLPLHGFVFYPGMGFPLQISHPGSKQLIDQAILRERLVVALPHRPEGEKEKLPFPDSLYRIGVLLFIHKLIKTGEGFYQVVMSGIKKVRVLEYRQLEPFLTARIESVEMRASDDQETEALLLNLRAQFRRMAEFAHLPPELYQTINSLPNPFFVAYLVASQLNLTLAGEQEILELAELKPLLKKVTLELNKKIETLEVSQEIQKNIKEDMDEKQKEFFLRQQMKAIQKELGDDREHLELDELQQRLTAAALSEEARQTASKELERLRRISPSSPEYTVSRTYLEWILDLPWLAETPDSLDLLRAQEVLDEDHSGLEKIKKRVIEFLAVRQLKKDIRGPILCFAGPPGVGKTSLGQSIARTLGKKFVRISLGGVRDEAEIRGHRRTYIGALPGRIIQNLKKAGANNPLFMLDEVDKLGADFRGDPSSALLEVLDPEQNYSFADHYLEIPFDLSKVMFITTANSLETIPGPLRDRMEVIELYSYTEEEKLTIAKRHLVAKQREANALAAGEIEFADAALRRVIRSYTREAGVRQLERQLGAICRSVAKDRVLGRVEPRRIAEEEVGTILGPPQFFPESLARSWGPGLATGLAWTPVGGVLLFIESARMKGSGELILTGKLGEVMKESATAALTFIRAHAESLGIDSGLFAEIDLHVHIPEGGTPKDGPSAGVALVVSLVSLLTGRAVRKEVAMTGEITLRGDVLPVGGVKEKVLAAIRAGIGEIILPVLNEKDIVEIPGPVKEGVVFHLIQDLPEALALVFAP